VNDFVKVATDNTDGDAPKNPDVEEKKPSEESSHYTNALSHRTNLSLHLLCYSLLVLVHISVYSTVCSYSFTYASNF